MKRVIKIVLFSFTHQVWPQALLRYIVSVS